MVNFISKDFNKLLLGIPAQLDWALKNVGQNVKDQKLCNAQYVYAALGSLEGAITIKHQSILKLSE